jgi:hypothetical protein
VRLRARLRRLERAEGARACGPGCPPVRWVYENDWHGRESEPPAPGPRCRRPPTVRAVVYDPDFFGNAERLGAVKAERWARKGAGDATAGAVGEAGA